MTAAPRGVARATARTKRVAWLVVDLEQEAPTIVYNTLRRAREDGWPMRGQGFYVVRAEYEWPVRAGRSRMGGAR